MAKIPAGEVAAILNLTERRVDRHTVADREIPFVHVSSLINTSLYGTFCAREFALKFLENTPTSGKSIPSKFEILYSAGQILGEIAVNKFIRRSAKFSQYAWGDWVCPCKDTRVRLAYKPEGMICNQCAKPVDQYAESDIRDNTIKVVGHADLLLRDEDGVIYIYEIKSIDRADIDFEKLSEPLGDHVLQASFYYWLLIAAGYKVHKYVRIIYIDRSLSQIYRAKPYKELSAPRISRERVIRLASKALQAVNGCETGKLPLRICKEITDSRAKECKVAISCFYRRLKVAKRMS